MKWTNLAFGILATVLVVTQAQAGEIFFNAAAFESVESGTGVSCARAVSSSATAWDHTYVTVAFDPNSDEACMFHFYWQSDMPTTGTVSLYLDGISASGTNDVVMITDIRCSTNAAAALTAGTPDTDTHASVSNLVYGAYESTPGVPASVAANMYCAVSIRRDADNEADNLDADFKIRGAYIIY